MDIQTPPRALTREQLKTLLLSALGGTLEFYDFIIFVFFAPIIGKLFFPAEISDWMRQLQTFAIFAAGYIARPLGGIFFAHYGDLLGRKKMFTLSIFMMAIPTLAIGLLPTFQSLSYLAPILLLVFRLIQGAAIGGEVPGAWVFVSEHVSPQRKGIALGVLTSGLTAGILLGSLIATLLHFFFNEQEILLFAWRFPFILGGIFGVAAVYLRSWLQETPIFVELKEKNKLAKELPLFLLFKFSKKSLLISMTLTLILSGAIVTFILMMPSLLQKYYFISSPNSLMANSLATLFLTFGCIFFGYLSDKIGGKKALLFGSLVFILSLLLFYSSLPRDEAFSLASSKLYLVYSLLGFSIGFVSIVPYKMVQLFTPEIRFSGLSFSYNVSYAIFGGLTPILIMVGMKYTHLTPLYFGITLGIIGMLLSIFSTTENN